MSGGMANIWEQNYETIARITTERGQATPELLDREDLIWNPERRRIAITGEHAMSREGADMLLSEWIQAYNIPARSYLFYLSVPCNADNSFA